eukprot:CAMPEP_0172492076 /NCGR_PEP_ID=MMETSP1066-20121228/23063_1 /TAXON_ID=671091 /ORGANISM="Coscinodiscus wailesii, Strain CCMP2513" /LENGTH=177 /DNA_ID=CAMNT_0013261471 /DNA_START=302 /DNA_END=832 /DNA_ORIENTATION=-
MNFQREALKKLVKSKQRQNIKAGVKNCGSRQQGPNYHSMPINSILVVAHEDQTLLEFINSLKRAMRYVSVTTAQTNEEALTLIKKEKVKFLGTSSVPTHGYDVIIVDGGLKRNHTRGGDLTGWELLQRLATEHNIINKYRVRQNTAPRRTFLVGLPSDDSSDQEIKNMLHMGVDTVW